MRCNYQPSTQQDNKQLVPIAPPLRVPPPPPPPPPPTSTGRRLTWQGILAIIAVGTVAWYTWIQGQLPTVYRDPYGIHYVKTAGGRPLAVGQDGLGNVFMYDEAGNLYYDMSDPRLGWYIVRPNGDIINAFQGENEDVQRVLLGNIKDMRAVNAERLGGVPIERLQAGLEQQKRIAGAPDSNRQFRRKVMGFSDNRAVPLPPNAPAQITKDGKVLPPPVLEEGRIDLERKDSWNPFEAPPTKIEKLERGLG